MRNLKKGMARFDEALKKMETHLIAARTELSNLIASGADETAIQAELLKGGLVGLNVKRFVEAKTLEERIQCLAANGQPAELIGLVREVKGWSDIGP